MGNPIYEILLICFITLTACNKNKCKEHEPRPCHLIDLSRDYYPVCGCNGVTYQNSGYAQCVGGITEYYEGECE